MEEKINLASLGIGNWSSGSKSTKSKMELIKNICELTGSKSLDISALTIKDIKSILKAVIAGQELHVTELPVSRIKAPFLSILVEAFPSVNNLNKLSVSSLKELIQAINK